MFPTWLAHRRVGIAWFLVCCAVMFVFSRNGNQRDSITTTIKSSTEVLRTEYMYATTTKHNREELKDPYTTSTGTSIEDIYETMYYDKTTARFEDTRDETMSHVENENEHAVLNQHVQNLNLNGVRNYTTHYDIESQIKWIPTKQKTNKKFLIAPPERSGDVKRILWFDSYHEDHGIRIKSQFVNFSLCKTYTNCELLKPYIVPSRDGVSYGPFDVDAILFQGCHLPHFRPPKRLSESQIWVFVERETWWYNGSLKKMEYPKGETEQIASLFKSHFNWTMSFRRDSDIPLLYGKIRQLRSNTRTHQLAHINLKEKIKRNKRNNYVYDEIFYRKRKTVVWMASDCKTKSLRELYIKQLRKYMDVYIYGKCGRKVCPKDVRYEQSENNCLKQIEQEFKFVLSFENTFYDDYVTEKLFDWFGRDIVQVVYGSADYSKITPPGTVVNAADFDSPKELAMFLYKLGASKTRYTNILKEKSKYYVVGHPEMQQEAYCRMCNMLNNVDAHKNTYPQIGRWWQTRSNVEDNKLYKQAKYGS